MGITGSPELVLGQELLPEGKCLLWKLWLCPHPISPQALVSRITQMVPPSLKNVLVVDDVGRGVVHYRRTKRAWTTVFLSFCGEREALFWLP